MTTLRRRSAGAFQFLLAIVLPLSSEGQERIAVLPEPGTPVVAAEVLLTVGPMDEEAELAGTAYLAARAAVEPIRQELDLLGASIRVTPAKDALSFTIVAAPDAWEDATRLLAVTLFDVPPDSLAVTRERRAIVSELRGRAANPADAATREIDRAFFGVAHPWGRPTVGTAESIQRIGFRDVARFVRENFNPERALVAVVGPVDAADVRAHFRPLLGATSPAPVEVQAYLSAERPIRRDYNSITTWVSASFRFSETADEEAMRFVTYLATETLSFSPERRSVYNVWSETVPRPGGGEIRIQVVIPPDEADDWVERVGDAIARIADRPLLDDVFENHLRRYRGERLMRLAAPEDRAHAAARQLLTGGRYGGIVPEVDDLTQERVRSAARSLGTPTLVLLGPSLND